MSKSGPAPVFSFEETLKYKEISETKEINEKRMLYFALSPLERERLKLWTTHVEIPRQEKIARKIEESRRKQAECRQQLAEADLRIKNLESAKKELFIQFGSKITPELDKIRTQQGPSAHTLQKSSKH